MFRLLKQTTAATVAIGPFLGSSDGVTPNTGLGAITGRYYKGDGTAASFSATMTHDSNGMYTVPLTTTHTGTLGILRVYVPAASCVPVWEDFMIVPAVVFDSLCASAGTDYLQVDLAQISGAAVNTASAQIGANVVTQADIDFGALQKTSLNAATPASVTGAVGSVTGAVTVGTNNDKTGYGLAADQAVNATKIGGVVQTGRDIGESVLISSGTGTGQLSVTSGVVKANFVQMFGSAITSYVTAAFNKFFNVSEPTGSVNSLPDAIPGGTNGLAIVGSVMGKSPATLNATDVTGNLPSDIKAISTGVDFTDSMKTSLNASTPSSIQGAVGSVTGNVGGSIGSLATQAKADVNAEVGSALNTAIPVSPAAGSINEKVVSIPNNPLLTNDARLPSTGVIAISGDSMVASNMVDITDLMTIINDVYDSGAGAFMSKICATVWGDGISGEMAQGIRNAMALAISEGIIPENTSIETFIATIKEIAEKFNFVGDDVKATLDSEKVTVATNEDKTNYSLDSTERVTLATSQPDYTPSKAGDKMDLVNAPNSTAIMAIQNGLALDATVMKSDIYVAPDNLDIGAIKTALEDASYGLNALLTAISTRMASFTYTAPDNTKIGQIKDQVDKLKFTGDDVKATLDSEKVTVVTNEDKTGYSGTATNMVSEPNNTNIASILAEVQHVTHGLGALLTAVNTRLAASGYVAPDNTKINQIKDQTDKLHFIGNDVMSTLADEKVVVVVNEDKAGYEIDTNTLSIDMSPIMDAIAEMVTQDLAPVLESLASMGSVSGDITFIKNCITNKKSLVKVGNSWHLIIRNTDDTADILNKVLKDKDGNDIADIHARIMAQELISNV